MMMDRFERRQRLWHLGAEQTSACLHWLWTQRQCSETYFCTSARLWFQPPDRWHRCRPSPGEYEPHRIDMVQLVGEAALDFVCMVSGCSFLQAMMCHAARLSQLLPDLPTRKGGS